MLALMRFVALALAMLLLTACRGADGDPQPRAVIETDGGEVAVDIEIAA